jgi:hypothetical protein
MSRFSNGLVIGIFLGVGGYWFVQHRAETHPAAEPPTNASATGTSGSLSDAWKARMDALDLRADQIKDELARTGKVVRRKAEDLGAQVSDATADARIVTAIKAKYAMDSNLSVWKISVSSTDGHVTLSGAVNTPEDFGRAVALALEADGVRDVISTIQVKAAS